MHTYIQINTKNYMHTRTTPSNSTNSPLQSNHEGAAGSWSCIFNACFITEIIGSVLPYQPPPLLSFALPIFQINICMVTPVRLNLLCAPGYSSPSVRFRSGFPSPSVAGLVPGYGIHMISSLSDAVDDGRPVV